MQLSSPEDLTALISDDGSVRVGISGGDWFGPGVASISGDVHEPCSGSDDMGMYTSIVIADSKVRASVRAYVDRPLIVFRTEAMADLTHLATGAFDQPSVGWPVFTPTSRTADPLVDDLQAVVFQCCEFALPACAGADLDEFFLLPHRPPTGWPLIVGTPDGPTLLLAPLDAFHDQTVGLNGGTVRCGWNGDLDAVPAGFASDLAVIAGTTARECLDRWGALLLTRAGTTRPGRWADALTRRPSYWTDNGAAYWYRTEPGHDVAGSIVAAVDDLRALDVPLGAVQLDSWFYPHTELRPFDTEEWIVPPSAMVAWEPREDVLPEGIGTLREQLGSPPLVAHIRHLSSQAPIANDIPVYRDGPYAVPANALGYDRWLDQCVSWGVETFEHDWLVEVFFGVRALRDHPGRARAWQEGIDRSARERGITLQWCMGTPADFAQTTTLTQVTSVRTCGDHGYIASAGQLWAWFCTTNALARSLGLMCFKDVFRTDPDVAGSNGEPEALLSALSTGPVGLGDRVGHMDTTLAMRTCRADGILIKPHTAIAATSASMFANAAFTGAVHVAECFSDQPAGRWGYIVAMHTNPSEDPVDGNIVLAELGDSAPTNDVIAWDWRRHTATRLDVGAQIPVSLARENWTYLVLAPVLSSGVAVIGDVSKFVTAGDARLEVTRTPDGVRLVVKGANETVTITGWATGAPTMHGTPITYDPETGLWTVEVTVPQCGWAAHHLVAMVT